MTQTKFAVSSKALYDRLECALDRKIGDISVKRDLNVFYFLNIINKGQCYRVVKNLIYRNVDFAFKFNKHQLYDELHGEFQSLSSHVIRKHFSRLVPKI